MNLYDFQTGAVERLAAEAARLALQTRTGRVIVLQSPTGSGKTTMGCELIRRAVAKGKTCLEIVHRRRLVDQFSDRLREFGVEHGVLMRGAPHERLAPVQVASRDTLLSRRGDDGFELPPADLVIVDEGRHAASSEFRKLLKPYEDRGAFIVLLDATPVLPDGRGLGPWAKSLVCAARTSDLVRARFLAPVKCFAPDRKRKGRKFVRGICGDLVESWQRYANGVPTVLFCSRVQHSRDAVEAFCQAGVRAAHVDAETSDWDRDRIFDQLGTGEVKVVSNVGIIKEGVDVPCLGCCQLWMDVPGRVAFLQACGRIMRPFPGKEHGILIDHCGACFRHGFPDEDTEWTLLGNADESFARKHDAGETEKALYCKHCELVYHGQPACPQCARIPAKPPRSVFAPPPVEHTSELLTEADRQAHTLYGREEMVRHWFRCLMVAIKRNGSFGMAAQVFKQKYKRWPADDFPMLPRGRGWKEKVADVYPDFGKKKPSSTP